MLKDEFHLAIAKLGEKTGDENKKLWLGILTFSLAIFISMTPDIVAVAEEAQILENALDEDEQPATEEDADEVTAEETDTSLAYENGFSETPKGGVPKVPDYNIDKSTVLRAAVFSDSGEQISDIYTNSYFVGMLGRASLTNQYTVSITCEPEDLFGYDDGIYVLGATNRIATGLIIILRHGESGKQAIKHMRMENGAGCCLMSTARPWRELHLTI